MVPPHLLPMSGNDFALTLTPALVFHLLMTLPDGRLAQARAPRHSSSPAT